MLGLGTLVFAVLGLGARSLLCQVRRTRQFLRALTRATPATLAGRDVVLFDDGAGA